MLNGTTPENQHRNRGPFKDFSVLLRSSKNPAKLYWGKISLKRGGCWSKYKFRRNSGKSCNFELNKKGEGNMKRGVSVGGTFIGHNAGAGFWRILEVIKKRKVFWRESFWSKFHILLIFFFTFDEFLFKERILCHND